MPARHINEELIGSNSARPGGHTVATAAFSSSDTSVAVMVPICLRSERFRPLPPCLSPALRRCRGGSRGGEHKRRAEEDGLLPATTKTAPSRARKQLWLAVNL